MRASAKSAQRAAKRARRCSFYVYAETTPPAGRMLVCEGMLRPVAKALWRVVGAAEGLADAKRFKIDPRLGMALVYSDSPDLVLVGKPAKKVVA